MDKKCTECGELKPLSDYHWAKKDRNLRHAKCKSCVLKYSKKYTEKNKDKIRASNSLAYKKLAEKRIEVDPPFYLLYKTCSKCGEEKYYKDFGLRLNRNGNRSIRAYCKPCMYQWRVETDPAYLQKANERAKKYRSEKPEDISLRVKAWKVANPDKHSKHESQYKQRRLQRCIEQSDGTLTQSFVRGLFAKAKVCCYCGYEFEKAKEKSLDHIIPLSRGGLHSASNVAICCVKCNTRKAAMTAEEYASKQKTTI